MSGVRLSRLFWIGAAAILIVAALVAVGSILRGDFGETEAQILGTLLSLLVAGATAIAGLALIERGVAREFGVAAIAGAALCLPVLQRFTRAASATQARVLGELDGVQLIATRGRADGLAVEAPAPGERLVLRRSG